MGTFDLSTTTDAMATALQAVEGITKAWPRPVQGANVDHAVIGYPRAAERGQGFSRSLASVTLPVLVIAGPLYQDATWERIDHLMGVGATAVWTALESVDDVFVTAMGVEIVSLVGGIRAAAVRYDCVVRP